MDGMSTTIANIGLCPPLLVLPDTRDHIKLCPVWCVTVDTSGRVVSTVPLAGGHLALDFVNTVGGLRKEPPSPADELIDTYDDLAIWCARLGVISDRQADSLRAAARRDERAAQRALRRTRALRDELIYPIFRSLADGKEPPAKFLDRLRDEERAALAGARLARAGGSDAMDWTWPPPRELTDPLRPIVHAAVELLTHGPLERVKTCGNCRWLFLDQSRNHSRRWCRMDECGIQMKHARFVEQRRRRRAASR
jgi:predicted RNA-binding Zn ribbon-like protein